jgi:hypothetical protein
MPDYPSVPVADPATANVETGPTPMPPDIGPLQTIPKAAPPPPSPPDGMTIGTAEAPPMVAPPIPPLP